MWNTIKSLFSATWQAIRSLFSSTFDILKNGVIALVKAIYDWGIVIIKGLGTITWNLFKSLGKALNDGLNYLYEKVLGWIEKW